MKKRNIYKDIVWLAVFCIFVSKGINWGKAYVKEQKTYDFHIQGNQELTADIIEEFRKLSGICSFAPTDTAAVTIRLGSYTLDTEITGLDLEEYPLKWKHLPGISKSGTKNEGEMQATISMGNTPVLFFGAEVFSSFSDASGYPPLKSQVEKWIEQYETLDLTVTDAGGWERKAKICGILSRPGDKVCMDKIQMKEVFGRCSHTAGGFMEIHGYKNMEKARGLLESAGFAVNDLSYNNNIPFFSHASASSFGQRED